MRMAHLNANDKIRMKDGGEAVVTGEFGSGGQGTVYKVRYNNKDYALKWYHPGVFKEGAGKFYKNLEENIRKGAPTKAFLWPLAITKVCNRMFGYIMDIRPNGYYELTDFFVGSANHKQVHFKSFSAVANAAITIIDGFRELHNNGYSYQDINNGNFFINPNNGDVLICDNDNVAPEGTNLGILGKQRYMAPQVVTGEKDPDKHTDRFSLAVILFRLLFINHPLEGKRSTPPCMTKEFERKYYGEEPLFIFDKQDDRNRPIPGTARNLQLFWPIYPDYIKELFYKAFSQDCMHGKIGSVTERDWLEAFFRFKTSIVRCPHCKKETFINNRGNNECIECHKPIGVQNSLLIKDVEYPIYPGVKLMQYHLDFDTDERQKVLGEIVVNPKNPSAFGIKNLTQDTWIIELPSGDQKPLNPGAPVPARPGFVVKFNNNQSEWGKIL